MGEMAERVAEEDEEAMKVVNIITGEEHECKTQEEFEAYVTSLTPWYDPKKKEGETNGYEESSKGSCRSTSYQ
jgi:hypothetical protein